MTTTPYPVPRSTRQTDILVGNGGAVYGPFDGLQIFDNEDVVVYSRATTDVPFSAVDVTVAKVSGLSFDFFTIEFAENIPSTTQFIVASERVPERSAGVKKGTMLDITALEKELSKIATTDQELRRDVGRALKVGFGQELQDLPIPDGISLLGWDAAGKLVNRPSEGASVALAEAAAEAALAAANAGFVFATEADFVAANIPAVLMFVETAGFAVAGDSGAHIKRRISTPGTIKPWHKQSADGAWWQITMPVIRPEMFAALTYVASPYGAAQVTAASDASAALDAAVEYASTFGSVCRLLGRMYKRTTEWLWASNLNIEGEAIGRWNPTLNQSIASGAGKPNGAGTVILYTGAGAKTRKALGVTDCRTAGGVVVNADAREPGFDSNFALTNYYNDDANTTTGAAATPVNMSAAVYMAPGTRGITARNLRLMPSFNGMAGYEAGTLTLGDDWDLGFYFDNVEWCNFDSVQAVGYWRKHGRFIRAGILETEGSGTPQTGCEHLMFHNCTFTGAAAGSAIRGPDLDRVIGVGSNYVEIEWRTNHPYDPTLMGNTFRLATGAGTFFDFTGLSKTGSVLRLTGVTPDPSANGVTTSSQITPGSLSNGIDNITDYSCILSGLDHQGAVRATSASLTSGRQTKPSACIEISGWRLNGYRCPFTEMMSQDDVGFHLHSCTDVNIGPNADIESKAADGLGLGLACIGSPAEGSNTRVTNPAGQTFVLTVDARDGSIDFRPFASSGPARFPTAPALGGYLLANQFHYPRQQYIPDNDTFIKPPNNKRVGFKDNDGIPRFYFDDATGDFFANIPTGGKLDIRLNNVSLLKASNTQQGVRHADGKGIPICVDLGNVADDTAVSYDFGASMFAGLVEVVVSNPSFNAYGKFIVRTPTTTAVTRVANADAGNQVTGTTGVLSGTTGVDGAVTFSAHTDNKLYVENRSGGTRRMMLVIMSGEHLA